VIILLIIVFLLVCGGFWVWPLLAGLISGSGMTDKPGALRHIRQLMVTYDIAPAEVETTFLAPAPADLKASQRSKGDTARTLFTYLGAILSWRA
jgi:hypothetical protein